MAYAIIKQECAEDNHLSINRMCGCLGVSRCNYYEWDKQMQLPAQQDPYGMEIRNEIRKIAIEFQCYGYRRMTRELRRRGYKVNHKPVLRIMGEDNLLCIKKKFIPRTTDSDHILQVYPNLAKDMEVTTVNQLWGQT